jgi:hypothetical protein
MLEYLVQLITCHSDTKKPHQVRLIRYHISKALMLGTWSEQRGAAHASKVNNFFIVALSMLVVSFLH